MKVKGEVKEKKRGHHVYVHKKRGIRDVARKHFLWAGQTIQSRGCCPQEILGKMLLDFQRGRTLKKGDDSRHQEIWSTTAPRGLGMRPATCKGLGVPLDEKLFHWSGGARRE